MHSPAHTVGAGCVIEWTRKDSSAVDDRTLDLIPRKKERLRSMQHTYEIMVSRDQSVSDHECKYRIQASGQEV